MRRPARKHLLALGLVLAVVGVAFGALTSRSGMPSRDHVDFYLRVDQYHAEIRTGHWPQLLPDAVRGGGHAFPRFYPPLAHLAAAAVYSATPDMVLASHLAMFVGVLLSAATMYLLVCALSGQVLPAVLGALVYGLSPYRATQLYVRGAFAEGWAMAWYPLIMLGLWRWGREGRPPAWWPLAVAAALLSHTATSLWALPVLGIVALLGAAARPSPAAWRSLGASAATSLGLAAFSLLPVAWYLSGVRAGHVDWMAATPEAIGSAAAVWRHAEALVVAQAIIAAGAIALIWSGRSRSGGAVARLTGWSLLAQVALVAMSSAPGRIWALVPQPWRYVQFGWRMLGPATFLSALGLSLLATRFTTRVGRAAVIMAAVLVAVGGVMQLRRAEAHDRSLVHAAILPWIKGTYGDLGLTLNGDYLPADADPRTLGALIARTRDSLLVAGALRLDQQGHPLAVRVPSGMTSVPLPLVAYDLFRVEDQSGGMLPIRSERGQLVAAVTPSVTEIRISRRLSPVVVLGMGMSVLSVCIVLLAIRREDRKGLGT